MLVIEPGVAYRVRRIREDGGQQCRPVKALPGAPPHLLQADGTETGAVQVGTQGGPDIVVDPDTVRLQRGIGPVHVRHLHAPRGTAWTGRGPAGPAIHRHRPPEIKPAVQVAGIPRKLAERHRPPQVDRRGNPGTPQPGKNGTEHRHHPAMIGAGAQPVRPFLGMRHEEHHLVDAAAAYHPPQGALLDAPPVGGQGGTQVVPYGHAGSVQSVHWHSFRSPDQAGNGLV